LPLVAPAGAFAAGIALAPWVPPALGWGLWAMALAAGLLCLALGRLAGALGAALAGTIVLGALRGAESPPAPDELARLPLPRHAIVAGRLAAMPARRAPDHARLLLEVERADGERRSGLLQLTVLGPLPALAPGARVAVEARLHRAAGFRNPGGFDYARHLARQGIRVVATVAAERLRVLTEVPAPWPARARRTAIDTITATLPPVSAALLAGLLLGERGDLPGEVQDGFRRAGVYHVLAVSGFNVALVAGAVFAVARSIRLGQRAAAAAAIVAVVGFALVAGGEPSVLRAVVMATLVLAALLLEREAAVANSLALAGLLILAVRPSDLHDPGFQLSFAATAGIVAAPLPRGLVRGALAVSAAAQAAVLPVTLAHFNQLSTLGLAANLAVVPLAAVATILGLAAVALASLSEALAGIVLDATWPALLLLRGVVALVAAVPGAVVHLPAPPWPAIACYAAGLGLALALLHRRRDPETSLPRRHAAGLALLALALVSGAALLTLAPVLGRGDGRLTVTVLDVGQGDAIVVEAPDGRALLVDAGGGGPWRLDAGERVVAPFLWNRGILRLAGAVVTHADADHAGGLASLGRLFSIGRACALEDLARGPCAFGDALLTWLNPAPEAGRGRNDASVVLRVDLGLATLLLASDIEARAERALVAAGAPLAATVLKVPHHGARGSSTRDFLAAARPAAAVISVGARNAFGHPDPRVLVRLEDAGAAVWRTDEDGAVLVVTDGRVLTVRGWASGRAARYCLDPEAAC
jgi:competence protein ComEC